jgi:outer membrane protein assembly factor BamD
MKKRLLILAVMGLMAFSSCNDFSRLVKSTDNEMKYEVAVDYYERGDYNHALQLFDLLQASFRNTPKGESITYKTALCYYYQDDFDIAGYYFNRFVQTYPFSKDAEKAAYMSAYCSYRLSPES